MGNLSSSITIAWGAQERINMKLKLTIGCSLVLSYFLLSATAISGQETPAVSPSPIPSATGTKSPDAEVPRPNQTGQVDPASENDDRSRRENLTEEEAAILPYYNNYLREYHLGPEDVISVEVFGQANYSKSGIVIPPTSRISYPLIPGGVFVGGKTVEQVAEDIKKKLDEYIIDPQVMVTLDKVGSARFSVLGKVASPGVKTMGRRYNLYEAIAEAGGIEKEGDKKRILLVRLNPAGGFTQTVIDMDKVMKGKGEVTYLVPGDQIIVPEKRWSLTKIISTVSKASALRILFGVPF
jgi:protein involved in polysaccharide export with SLBB domain